MSVNKVLVYVLLKSQAILLSSVFILAGSVVSEAQSGRRAPKRAPSSPPATLPAPETTEPVAPVKNNPPVSQIPVLFMMDIPQTLYLKFAFPEQMQVWVADRLKRSSAFDIKTDEPGSRNQAIKRAKKETRTHVIWLELAENNLKVPEPNERRSQTADLSINYYIYLPSSGKAIHNGRAYLDFGKYQGGILNNKTVLFCYPKVTGDDLLLLQASLEVAERIMSHFNVPVPPVCSK
jgi:hypothetical protein